MLYQRLWDKRVTGYGLLEWLNLNFLLFKVFKASHTNMVRFFHPVPKKGFAAGMMVLICRRLTANQKKDPLCPLCLERSGR